jgi:hypothetical protein
MKATEEYRDSNGIRDMDCEINDSTSIKSVSKFFNELCNTFIPLLISAALS